MAAAAAKVIRNVQAHIPLIKFPHRPDIKLSYPPMSGQASASMPADVSTPVNAAPVISSDLLPSFQKPVGSLPRGTGLDARELPLRFRRKLITQQEIEFIERGGPE